MDLPASVPANPYYSLSQDAIEPALYRIKTTMKPEAFTSDDEFDLADKWLRSFPNHKTREAYSHDIVTFATWWKSDLRGVIGSDLDYYAEHLSKTESSVNAQRRSLSALRSFYRYAHQENAIENNSAKNLKLPRAKDELAQRIISEVEFYNLLVLEENPRNRLLIELLYATGGRISEALAAKWKDAQPREDGGQIVLFGKRDKTRTVLIPASVWAKLIASKGEASDDAFIFPSPRKAESHLSASQAWRIVRAAAAKAKLKQHVSPHWFRHAHASHAIERGASVVLVKETLGHSSLTTTTRYTHARPDDSSGLYLSIK